jgi:hypothetical protein
MRDEQYLARTNAVQGMAPGYGSGLRLLSEDALAFRSKVHHFIPMIDWTQCPAVERIPGKVSGAWPTGTYIELPFPPA